MIRRLAEDVCELGVLSLFFTTAVLWVAALGG